MPRNMPRSSLILSSDYTVSQRLSFLIGDPHFTREIWESLFQLLGMDLQFNTIFHPQTDGQSERMIQMMKDFRRPYVERQTHTWSQQLPIADFVANNFVNVATRFTPFT